MSNLVFVVAGPLDQRTGGYLYDARIVDGLRGLGRDVRVVELPGDWPAPDDAARDAFAARLAECADGAVVVVDGLVGGAAPGPIEAERERLRVVALVHHPLADEASGGRGELGAASLEAREARTLAAARGVIVTSAFTAERVAGLGATPARIRIVEPGTEAVPRGGGDARTRPDGPVELLCLGSVVPRKDQGALVRALERMHAADPRLAWHCRMVGSVRRDPDYATGLVRATADSTVHDRVEFMGELDDGALEEVWRGTDVFVSASRYEGYGMALTEAMVRGLPVVAVAGGAVRCTVPENVGVLVPCGDIDALADALRRVVSDGACRRALAARSEAHAGELPDWPAQVDAFHAALGELTNG
jgi:glycosyltransferase involved in cell wall biosynthesis